ncbi:THO complex subunit 6 [Blattella germanica]|nr:THO complex subunit 6 [Blattella germanica]
MVYCKADGYLYAGCGDNRIYVFSLEDGKLIRTMEGHDDYIHSIHCMGSQLVSGSEDGSVRLWDVKQKTHTNIVQPHLSDKLARPHLGKWIGSAALNDDWLVCGGGPRLSLWHLRSLDVTTAFQLDDAGIHVAMFYDDRIMAGGASPNFYNLNYTGDIYAQIPFSSTCIYSVVYQEQPLKVCLTAIEKRIICN